MRDPDDITGVGAQALAAEEEDARKRRALVDKSDLQSVMADKRGRRFIHRLLTQSNPFHDPFSGADPYTTAYQCGAMRVGKWLTVELMTHTPVNYKLMLEENAT